jgi:hypothetical protein
VEQLYILLANNEVLANRGQQRRPAITEQDQWLRVLLGLSRRPRQCQLRECANTPPATLPPRRCVEYDSSAFHNQETNAMSYSGIGC